MSTTIRALGAALVALLPLLGAGESVAGTAELHRSRHAWVIANDAYEGARLRCAEGGAEFVADVLRDTGFEVEMARNLTYPALLQSIVRTSKQWAGTDGVTYFAGMGRMWGEEDFILPVQSAAVSAPPSPLRVGDVLKMFGEAQRKVAD